MKIFTYLFDLISVKKCYSCKKEGHFFCIDCYNKEYDFKSICYVCKGVTKNFLVHKKCRKNIYYDKAIVLKHYKTSLIKKLIKQAKFYGKSYLFSDFGEYLYERFLLNNKINFLKDYLIIPVPSYFFRKIKRGNNSSEIICKYFSKISKISYNKNIIKKTKNTRQQSKLNKKERLENIKNSFKINKKYIDKIDNKKIIIIDDVISTGSTINEISKVLKQNGVKEIIVLTIASD